MRDSEKKTERQENPLAKLGWLRAGILGANDGIISTSALMVGVASASASSHQIFFTGIAGLVSGALSMAAGEYVSVSSQADTEHIEIERVRQNLKDDPEGERRQLVDIYVKRGLTHKLATEVVDQLTRHNAVAAHARDELGFSRAMAAQPIQAAVTSALAFTLGAIIPVLVSLLLPTNYVLGGIFISAAVLLAVLGATGAKIAQAPMLSPTLRVVFWGAIAMGVTSGIGYLFDASTG